jgi:Uma2 family endonuclease
MQNDLQIDFIKNPFLAQENASSNEQKLDEEFLFTGRRTLMPHESAWHFAGVPPLGFEVALWRAGRRKPPDFSGSDIRLRFFREPAMI